MLCLPGEDITSNPDGGSDFCTSRCRESYLPGPGGICVRESGGSDINGNPFVADQYQRRAPMLINWGIGAEPASVSQSDWASVTGSSSIVDSTPVENIQIVPTMIGFWMAAPIAVLRTVNLGAFSVYIVQDGGYTKMVTDSGLGKYYYGSNEDFNPDQWESYITFPQGYYEIQYLPKNIG